MTKIQTYVENMFSGLPKRKDIIEMKLDIIDNMEEKYKKLIDEGKSESEAFGEVVSDFGSMEEIKRELGFTEYVANEETIRIQEEYEKFRKKFIIAITAGVALCLIAVITLIGLYGFVPEFESKESVVPVIIFLGIILIAVCIFVYFGMQNEKYEEMKKGVEVVMDGFQKNKEESDIAGAISGTIMLLATAFYLIMGFVRGAWHPTWIVFPVGGILCGVVSTIASAFEKK